ncbi:MAG: O-methyltransferase [Lachnospiraceae bacterium]|nr:O-methyltransferase [Lachnospiraceae bacterium]
MILPERMSVYINSLDTGNGAFLDDLQRFAVENHVPVIRPDMQSFLKVLLAIHRPQRILEVGTAVGFSALLMAANTSPDCRITTIENYEKRIPLARENFRRAGMEERITLLPGDAMKILPTLKEPFDFIFMDAAKGQYIHFLPEVLRLLRLDGVLLSDNVLQDGDIIESHYAIEQRDRTIYKRMREYLYVLKHTEGLLTSVVAVGDGAAVTVKQADVTVPGKNIDEAAETPECAEAAGGLNTIDRE